MFTIVMLYIGTKVMDFIIEGLNTKKAITVISENKSEIAEQVNTLMDRGVTILSGREIIRANQKRFCISSLTNRSCPC